MNRFKAIYIIIKLSGKVTKYIFRKRRFRFYFFINQLIEYFYDIYKTF